MLNFMIIVRLIEHKGVVNHDLLTALFFILSLFVSMYYS